MVIYVIPLLAILIVLPSLWAFLSLLRHPVPKSVEWATKGHGPLSMLKTLIYSMYSIRATLHRGYNNFSETGKPYLIIHWNLRPRVILPREHIPWIASQPEEILSHKRVDIEQLAQNSTAQRPDARDFGMRKIFSKELARALPQLYAVILEASVEAIDTALGSDPEWRLKKILDVITRIVAETSYRVILGPELSRDKRLVTDATSYNFLFGVTGILVGQVAPWPLKQLVGMVVGLPLKYYFFRLKRRLVPVFEERLRAHRSGAATRSKSIVPDGLAWTFNVVIDSEYGSTATASEIADFFIQSVIPITNFPSIVGTNFMQDLLAADADYNLQETLRAEAHSFFNSDCSHPKSPTNHLQTTESALRETLRTHPLVIYSVCREVMPKQGVIAPDGTHLPQGSWVCVSSMDIHHDEDLYSHPTAYNPYRFIHISEAGKPVLKEMLSTPSPSFLAFSFGDHVCPGRVYASQMMKVIVAYMLANYEFRPVRQWAPGMIIGMIQIPSFWTCFSVRRRRRRV
ncbi:cytochrome P450 [Aspergillus egyptiacus]|nr:cytochrome P450 [Aspergillus egyptiacus]